MDAVDKFYDHLDVCKQCENHPFDLCSIGDELLVKAATSPDLMRKFCFMKKEKDKNAT